MLEVSYCVFCMNWNKKGSKTIDLEINHLPNSAALWLDQMGNDRCRRRSKKQQALREFWELQTALMFSFRTNRSVLDVYSPLLLNTQHGVTQRLNRHMARNVGCCKSGEWDDLFAASSSRRVRPCCLFESTHSALSHAHMHQALCEALSVHWPFRWLW